MARRTVPLLLLAALLACAGSDPQPLVLVREDPFYGNYAVIAGGGASELAAYTRSEGLATTVRLVRHDASRPDELETVGDVAAEPRDLIRCLFVSGGYLVVCRPSDLSVAELQVFDLADPARAPISIPWLGLDAPADVAIAAGRLLAGAGSTLVLVDLARPASPDTFTAPSPVTAVAARGVTFFAFTVTGYVDVTPEFDPAIGPIFSPGTKPAVRNLRRVIPDADGLEAMAAGPSTTLGKVRVVRLDLLSLTVLRGHEVDGEYGGFAWDGAATSVVALADTTRENIHEGYVVREDGGGFRSEGIPLPRAFRSASRIVAHGDRLLMVHDGGFGLFRMP